MAELLTPTPSGAQTDPELPRPNDETEDVGPFNTRQEAARNQAGVESTKKTSWLSRLRRQRSRFRNVPDMPDTAEVADTIVDNMNAEDREEGLQQQVDREVVRRMSIQEIRADSSDELIDQILNLEGTPEGFQVHLSRILEQRYPGISRQRGVRNFVANARAFANGEFDMVMGNDVLTDNTAVENTTNFRGINANWTEIGRRGLRAVANRKNLVSAGLIVGTGLLTGGVAPMAYAAIGGMIAGRAAVEAYHGICGRENELKGAIREKQYQHYAELVRLAQQIRTRDMANDEKVKLTSEFLDLYYQGTKIAQVEEDELAQLVDRQNRASDWGATLGSVAGVGIGAGWNYLSGGFNGLMEFVGKINVDWNTSFHGVHQVNDSLMFAYNHGDKMAQTVYSGLGGALPGAAGQVAGAAHIGVGASHALGSTMAQVGLATGAKVAAYLTAGAVGQMLGGIRQGTEVGRVEQARERTNTVNQRQETVIRGKMAEYDRHGPRQETHNAAEATFEEKEKPVPRKGEVWYIQNPADRDYYFQDVFGNTYNQASGARLMVMNIEADDAVEVALVDPDTGYVDRSRRARIPLMDMARNFNPDVETVRLIDEHRARFENWLKVMELDNKVVREDESKVVLRDIEGVIINFQEGTTVYDLAEAHSGYDPLGSFTPSNPKILNTGNYRLTSIVYEPYSPYAMVGLVDLTNPDRPTYMIRADELIRGRRAYPEKGPYTPPATDAEKTAQQAAQQTAQRANQPRQRGGNPPRPQNNP